MLAQDPLNLQRVQLKAAQEWTHKGEQLSFIFPKAGVGKWVAGAVVQKLGPGDVLVLNATLGGKLCAAGPGEMVFWCISLQLEHLFPLFESSEICLLQTISDGFKTARLYPAAIPVAQECHRRLAKIPLQVNPGPPASPLSPLSPLPPVAPGIGLIVNGNNDIANMAAEYGLPDIFIVNDNQLNDFSTTAYSKVIADFAKSSGCDIVLFSGNAAGLELAPKVSVKLEAGYISDVVALDFKDGNIVAKKPNFFPSN